MGDDRICVVVLGKSNKMDTSTTPPFYADLLLGNPEKKKWYSHSIKDHCMPLASQHQRRGRKPESLFLLLHYYNYF